MTVTVDQNKCIGCGLCTSICPRAFELKNGKSVPKSKDADKKNSCAKEAAQSCPVGAITIS